MFGKLKLKSVNSGASSDKDKRRSTPQKWALRYPETKYDKYIEEKRSINEKKRGNACCGKSYYKDIVKKSSIDSSSKDAIQIEKDLERTNLKGRGDLTETEMKDLREVLKAVAYEMRNEGGYCQSMNFIAALLLIYMENELAFYTQVCITRDLFSGYFTEDLNGMRIDERVFLYLLAEKLPSLTDHLDENDISLTHLTFHWFLCLFINVLPLEVTEYIWDRIFYYGSHVIHTAALAIFVNNERDIMRLSDLEEFVVYLNERLDTCSIRDFQNMESLGVTLSRVRIMRVDYKNIIQGEESEMKHQIMQSTVMNLKQSSRKSSIRGLNTSFVVHSASDESEDEVDVFTVDTIISIKDSIVKYIISHCSETLGVSKEKITSKHIRDYCASGYTKGDFFSLWNELCRDGIVKGNNIMQCTSLFEQYKKTTNHEDCIDIRDILVGLMDLKTDSSSMSSRLQYFFSIYDMKNEGFVIKSAFRDFIVSVYESTDDMQDIQRSADKYVNIIFAVNANNRDGLSFMEFRNLCLIQPQISSYLGIYEEEEDEDALTTNLAVISEENQKEEEQEDFLRLKTLPPILADHPMMKDFAKMPSDIQRKIASFLQDMAIIVRDNDQLRKDMSHSNNNSSFNQSFMKSIRLSSRGLMTSSITPPPPKIGHIESIMEDESSPQPLQPSPIPRVALRSPPMVPLTRMNGF